MVDQLRVSAAGLAKIILDDQFLVVLNYERLQHGLKVYTPFGGGLKFYDSAQVFLNNLGAQYENGNDLRLSIPVEKWDLFQEWFYRRENRDVSIYQELKEEFVGEEKVFSEMTKKAYSLEKLITVEPPRVPTDRPGYEGLLTQRIFEMHTIIFAPDYEAMIRKSLTLDETRLTLVDRAEIQTGYTKLGINIGPNCLYLLS